MKLIRARVQNFRSIEASEEFTLEDLTCLVGNNEAGKTAVLTALRGLNPTDGFKFDKTRDYPRRYLTRSNDRHPGGKAEVIRTWWRIEDEDKAAIVERFGEGCLTGETVEISTGFGRGKTWAIPLDETSSLEHLASNYALTAPERI